VVRCSENFDSSAIHQFSFALKMSEEENPENYFYNCEECDITFDNYDQHIRDYHADAEVVLKQEEDEENEEMEVEFLDDAVTEGQIRMHRVFSPLSVAEEARKSQ
jgi:hypothetical protein